MIGPICYIGGKNRLAKRIIDRIPAHKAYVEVFAGGAQVLFHKEPSKIEVLNDLSSDVVNFFRVCQLHHDELVRFLRFMIVSRKSFELLRRTPPETLTDIQRAARFFYLQKNAFAGRVVRQSYHYCVSKPSNYLISRIPDLIDRTHERLQDVQVECLPYQEVLRKYDRKDTFFYLDPPYRNRPLYAFNFTDDDYQALSRQLATVQGTFLLSLNDEEFIRRTFSAFKLEEVEIAYSAQVKSGRRYRELFISNY